MPAERTDAMQTFLAGAGWGGAARRPLPGDASTRRYVRLAQNGRRAMLMDQPPGAETPAAAANATPDERRALGYNAVARLAGADCARFVAAANYLRRRGLSAPEILAADPKEGFVLLEDLGDGLYADVVESSNELELYRGAAEVLATLHADRAPAVLPPDKDLHAFDETAMLAEVDLLTDWFLPVGMNRAATPEEVESHRALWRSVLAPMLAAPPVFVHRDYHAQNLLWLPQRSGIARVGLIDFQDAVAGAKAYDLISLVEDARRDVAPEVGAATTTHYLETMRAQGTALDEEDFRAQMAVMAAQRNAKIVGIFARLFKRDGKERYLGYLPRVWGYLNRDLDHPALAPLKAWYDARIPMARRGDPREGARA
ncbi:MAG TPA: phosphotransferase [Rhizomicrobium sp.]|jgi:aminoglycoside/choline kinase family phosphotransferase|nr:phosphotransferase [Rhizomicrobium sp.]